MAACAQAPTGPSSEVVSPLQGSYRQGAASDRTSSPAPRETLASRVSHHRPGEAHPPLVPSRTRVPAVHAHGTGCPSRPRTQHRLSQLPSCTRAQAALTHTGPSCPHAHGTGCPHTHGSQPSAHTAQAVPASITHMAQTVPAVHAHRSQPSTHTAQAVPASITHTTQAVPAVHAHRSQPSMHTAQAVPASIMHTGAGCPHTHGSQPSAHTAQAVPASIKHMAQAVPAVHAHGSQPSTHTAQAVPAVHAHGAGCPHTHGAGCPHAHWHRLSSRTRRRLCRVPAGRPALSAARCWCLQRLLPLLDLFPSLGVVLLFPL
nr:uncharacterized protein LOC127485779 isoform X3 [Oryctolagus cuniculus]